MQKIIYLRLVKTMISFYIMSEIKLTNLQYKGIPETRNLQHKTRWNLRHWSCLLTFRADTSPINVFLIKLNNLPSNCSPFLYGATTPQDKLAETRMKLIFSVIGLRWSQISQRG